MAPSPQSGRAARWLAYAVVVLATPALAQVPPPINQRPPPAAGAQAIHAYSSLPLTFEPNPFELGFLARGQGYTLQLNEKEAVLSPDGAPPMRLKFSGSRRPALVAGRDLLRARTNYFLGRDPKQWRTNVPNYAAVEYSEIYPGVNAVFHGDRQRVEFDFEVAPGADPRRIALDVEGASGLRINSHGDAALWIGPAGEMLLEKPRLYQMVGNTQREIPGHYVLRRGRIRIAVGPYDHSRPLVIDPTLAYSTYFGGNAVDQINGIAVDASNDAYIVGTTSSGNLPVSSGAYQTTCPACSFIGVAFVAKLDPTQSGANSLIYSTYVGPEGPASAMPDLLGSSTGNAIIVDSSGDAYLTGQANSRYFPANNPPSENASSCGAFVVELDPNGANLLGSRCLGGAANDQGNAITQDSSGNIYVGGVIQTSGLAVPANAVQTLVHGSRTPFIAKLSSNLTALLYFTYMGGGFGDVVSAIAVDAAGEAYLACLTYAESVMRSLPFPAAVNQYGANFTGSNGQGFVAKISSDATQLLFAGFLGGTKTTSVNALALDASGNAYVTGSTTETDLQPASNPPVAGPNCLTPGTVCSESFVAEFNSSASSNQLIFLSYFGGVFIASWRQRDCTKQGEWHCPGQFWRHLCCRRHRRH